MARVAFGRACLLLGLSGLTITVLSGFSDVDSSKELAPVVGSRFPSEAKYPVGKDIVILVANPWHGNGNRSKNGLGHQDNQFFPAFVSGPEADESKGWKPCANRVHLISADSGYNNSKHFIEYSSDAHGTGLWVAHSFHVPMRRQIIWMWNGNPDSAGDSGDIQWRYRLATGYYLPPAHGNANKIIIKCKHETTKAALEQAPPIFPGEVVGTPGDDDKPDID